MKRTHEEVEVDSTGGYESPQGVKGNAVNDPNMDICVTSEIIKL